MLNVEFLSYIDLFPFSECIQKDYSHVDAGLGIYSKSGHDAQNCVLHCSHLDLSAGNLQIHLCAGYHTVHTVYAIQLLV